MFDDPTELSFSILSKANDGKNPRSTHHPKIQFLSSPSIPFDYSLASIRLSSLIINDSSKIYGKRTDNDKKRYLFNPLLFRINLFVNRKRIGFLKSSYSIGDEEEEDYASDLQKLRDIEEGI